MPGVVGTVSPVDISMDRPPPTPAFPQIKPGRLEGLDTAGHTSSSG